MKPKPISLAENSSWTPPTQTPLPEDRDSFLEKDYAEPYYAWKSNTNPQTTGQLLRSVDPILQKAIKSYAGNSESGTIKTQAKLLALEAINRYDPKRAKLQTHLLSHLRALHRHAAKLQQTIRLPERVALDLSAMGNAKKELADQLGREPSLQEISDYSGISMGRLEKLQKAQPGLTTSQTTLYSDDGEDSVAPAIIDGRRQQAWLDFIYHDLSPVDQLIFEYTSGYKGRRPLSKGDIAKKLHISPSAVSQRLAKIQEKIDARDSTNLF